MELIMVALQKALTVKNVMYPICRYINIYIKHSICLATDFQLYNDGKTNSRKCFIKIYQDHR